ncbi:response regulator transcription factor [uncultured Maritimibacter sp.]|jgi:DNA-binding CsgD family transcriptional regulator|uniref:response regulator transcription factor n=1 Tax=uncultured Maritimibacter sp. TaxID=991866 RepID=UPI00261E578B|nr:response regulator transcription factor [uncultured Maritimibacter sp.]
MGANFLFCFVGSGRMFSDVVLRTIETEFDDVRAVRMPDLTTWELVQTQTDDYAKLDKRLLIVDERDIDQLADYLQRGSPITRNVQVAIAVRSEASARQIFTDWSALFSHENLSLLPMNLNLSSWIQLLRLIDCGTRYVPSYLLQPVPRDTIKAADDTSAAEPAVPHKKPVASSVPPETLAAKADDAAPAAQPTSPNGTLKLTPRENQVLELVASGHPNKVIARDLDVSCHTVKLHIHRIIAKLGVHNRTEAAIWYHQSRNG